MRRVRITVLLASALVLTAQRTEASAEDRWIWSGPANASAGMPSFFDARRGGITFLEDYRAPVLWTLSPDVPRTWSVTPVTLDGPWITSNWCFDPAGDRAFVLDQVDASGQPYPGPVVDRVAVLRLGTNARLSYVPVRGANPGAHDGAMCVYDSRRQRVLVFGGRDPDIPDSLVTRIDALDVSGDSASWSSFDVSAPGLPVEGAHAVYDSLTDRVIVVGGQAASGGVRGTVFSLDLGAGTGWLAWSLADSLDTNMTTAAGPRLVLDPVRRRLLFVRGPDGIEIVASRRKGPQAEAVATDDSTLVWQLGLDAPVGWSPVPITGPSPRSVLQQFVYDPGRDRVTAYGGFGVNELHELVLDGASAWSGERYSDFVFPLVGAAPFVDGAGRGIVVIDPAGMKVWRVRRGAVDDWKPLPTQWPARPRFHDRGVAVYDSLAATGYVFGGSDGSSATADLTRFRILPSDSVTWDTVATSGTWPPARELGSGVLDPVRRRWIVFGGRDGTASLGDTWAMDLDPPQRWHRLEDRGVPPSARAGASAVYDSRRDAMVVFGGETTPEEGSRLDNDTYTLSLADGDIWQPLGAAGRAPQPRSGHGAVYDPLRDRMLVFWGYAYAGGRADCAELDLSSPAAWRTFDAAGFVPPGRAEFGVLYDAQSDQALCVGGLRTANLPSDFPYNVVVDFSADPVRTPPPLVGPPLSVLGLAPNPTRDAENVAFGLPVDADVRAQIYAANGRLVRDLGRRHYLAGTHVLPWNGVDATGARAASGVYYARLSMLGRDFTGKFVLLH